MNISLTSTVKYILSALFSILSTKVLYILLETLNIARDKKSKTYSTYHQRPMYADVIGTISDNSKVNIKTAIILQGPVVTENDFTLETIKIYKRHFKNCQLIFSTWDDEDDSHLSKISDENIDIILNKKPYSPGPQNINYQIISSFAGVKKAKNDHNKYVLKTRTDQRMYSPNVVEFFLNIIDTFPVLGVKDKQKKRIVGTSLNTFKYRLYGLSDMVTFGEIDDMMIYWGCKLDDRDAKMQVFQSKKRTSLDIAQQRLCEIYLTTEFLNNIGRNIEWTLTDSWKVFAEKFCVVDKESLDLFWPKYEFRTQEQRWRSYDAIKTTQELCFRDWFILYSNYGNNIIVPEHILASSNDKIENM
ncbi:MAG: WavE lipopolysaccharide synthesis family protein [Bacteroidota bacterium]